MLLSRRERVLIIILGALLILVLGFKLLVEPAYYGWSEKNARAGVLESLDKTAGATIGGEVPDTAEAVLEAAAFFLPNSTPEQFHRYIQGFFHASGLTVEAVTVMEQNSELPSSFSIMGIQLSAIGTQAQAMRFLNGLEQENKAIVVERFDMLPAREIGKVTLAVKLRVYCVNGPTDDSIDFDPASPTDTSNFHFVNQGGVV